MSREVRYLGVYVHPGTAKPAYTQPARAVGPYPRIQKRNERKNRKRHMVLREAADARNRNFMPVVLTHRYYYSIHTHTRIRREIDSPRSICAVHIRRWIVSSPRIMRIGQRETGSEGVF